MRSPGGFTFCQTLVEGEPSLVRDGSTILDQVCLDVPAAHWESEVAFWAALTGREPQVGALPEFVRLVEDGRLRLLLQRLDEADGPVRAHPDLATADRAGDTDRHVGLGAVLQGVHDFWTVLTAPGGQVYCLTDRDPVDRLAPGVTRPMRRPRPACCVLSVCDLLPPAHGPARRPRPVHDRARRPGAGHRPHHPGAVRDRRRDGAVVGRRDLRPARHLRGRARVGGRRDGHDAGRDAARARGSGQHRHRQAGVRRRGDRRGERAHHPVAHHAGHVGHRLDGGGRRARRARRAVGRRHHA